MDKILKVRDYCLECSFFVKRSKGVAFALDLWMNYRGDHSPQAMFSLVVYNWTVIDLSVYNIKHED